MSRWRKLGINVLLMTIGSIGTKVLAFLLVPLYTSVLSTQDYGVSDLIVTTISLLMPLFTATISESMLRFALEDNYDKKQIFTIGIIVNLIGFALLLCFSPLIFFVELLRPYYICFLVYYLVNSLYVSLSSYTRGIGKVTLFTVSGVCQTIALLVSNIIGLVVLHRGIEGYLFSYIFSNLFAIAVLIFGGKEFQYWISPKKIDKSMVKTMLRYSVPMIPNSISWWVSNSSDKYILTAICGATVNGIYSVAYKIPTILSVFYNIILSAWRLSAVEDFGSEETSAFYSSVYRKMEGGLVLVSAGIILFNKLLSRLLYAKDFYSARFFVPVLVIAFLLHGLGEFYGSIYTSARQTGVLFYSSLTGAICNIILNIILIPQFGGLGAAIATLLSYGIILIFRAVHSRKIMKMKIDYRHGTLAMILLVAMCIVQTIDFSYAFIFAAVLFSLLLVLERNVGLEISRKFLAKQ